MSVCGNFKIKIIIDNSIVLFFLIYLRGLFFFSNMEKKKKKREIMPVKTVTSPSSAPQVTFRQPAVCQMKMGCRLYTIHMKPNLNYYKVIDI